MSVVEFALVVPVLLTLLIGIMEFSMIARNNLMLSNAAREGARSLSLGRSTSAARARMKSMTGMLDLQDSAITFTYSTNDGASFLSASNGAAPTAPLLADSAPVTVNGVSTVQNSAPPGSLVKVAIQYPHKSLTGFFPFLKGFILKTNAVMRRES